MNEITKLWLAEITSSFLLRKNKHNQFLNISSQANLFGWCDMRKVSTNVTTIQHTVHNIVYAVIKYKHSTNSSTGCSLHTLYLEEVDEVCSTFRSFKGVLAAWSIYIYCSNVVFHYSSLVPLNLWRPTAARYALRTNLISCVARSDVKLQMKIVTGTAVVIISIHKKNVVRKGTCVCVCVYISNKMLLLIIPLETAVIWSEIDDKTGQIVLFRYERERQTYNTYTLVCARKAKLHLLTG